MRCLTFSDLSLGNDFAGGRRGREQQCVELSLPLFKCCRPGLSIGPLLLIGQECGREIGGRFSPSQSVVGKATRQMIVFAHCCGETGSGHIVESNLCVIRSNDGVKSLTAAHRKRVNALTDARYMVPNGRGDFFRWLVFRHVAPVLPLNRTLPTRQSTITIIAAEMFTMRHKGHPVFGSRKCHIHNATAADLV